MTKPVKPILFTALLLVLIGIAAGDEKILHKVFNHPGCLSTEADLKRMAEKVALGAQPWKGSWDILVRNTNGFLDDAPGAQSTMFVDSSEGSNNFIRLARDAAKAYQLALRYHGSGDSKFADKAVQIFNNWATVHKKWNGNSNVALRAGLYGYQFACAAELLRDYKGWQRKDFEIFKNYMLRMFYSVNDDFLARRNGTVPDHYWANWVQAAQASMMAIGVLCDRRDIFNKAVDYFYNGKGNENIQKAVNFVHPNGLGQWQESGRDQGHTLMGPQLLGTICEIAWNQGVDLYSHDNNRFLRGVEYISKYNLGLEVPFVVYVREYKHPGKASLHINGKISPHGRGIKRPGWDLVYNHYVNRLGLAAPYTGLYAKKVRPEGGGFNFGGNSGGFDGLGFTTLTHTLDSFSQVKAPTNLQAHLEGSKITLSWMGSARATAYEVKRADRVNGQYSLLSKVDEKDLFYIDTTVKPGQKYYYTVSALISGKESVTSKPLAVKANYLLTGKIIGTDGSYGNFGAIKETVFDNSLNSYFDPPKSEAWVGLDLGENTKAAVTMVEFCPRKDFEDRMTGGKFQGSNSPDFSSGTVDLYVIPSIPVFGTLTSQTITNAGSFRYLRYIPPKGGWCNLAEIKFFGKKLNNNVQP